MKKGGKTITQSHKHKSINTGLKGRKGHGKDKKREGAHGNRQRKERESAREGKSERACVCACLRAACSCREAGGLAGAVDREGIIQPAGI